MRHLKNIIYKIKRVVDFIPIIWKGYDWDSHFAIELFKYQLQRTANMFESGVGTYGEGVRVKAQKIRTAIRLMDKVYNEEYNFEFAEKIEKLYGKDIVKLIPSETCDVCLVTNNSVNLSREIKNEYAIDDEHQREIDSIRAIMIRESTDKQKRAHKILWDFLEHNIQNWWD